MYVWHHALCFYSENVQTISYCHVLFISPHYTHKIVWCDTTSHLFTKSVLAKAFSTQKKVFGTCEQLQGQCLKIGPFGHQSMYLPQ